MISSNGQPSTKDPSRGRVIAAWCAFVVAYTLLVLLGYGYRLGGETDTKIRNEKQTVTVLGAGATVTIKAAAGSVEVAPSGQTVTDESVKKVVTILGDETLSDALGFDRIATFWPSVGFAFGILLLAPRRAWPALLAVVLIVELILAFVYAMEAFEAGSHWRWAVGLATSLAHVGEAPLAALLVRWRLGERAGRWGRRTALGIVGAGIVAAAAGGLFAATAVQLAAQDTDFRVVLLQRFFSDGIGLVLMAPLVLTWAGVARWIGVAGRSESWLPGERHAEAALFLVLTFSVAAHVFGRDWPINNSPFHQPYLIYPFFIWASLRLRPRVVMTGLCLTVLVLVHNTGWNFGPFAMPWEPVKELFGVQGFLAVMVVSTVILCGVVADHKRFGAELCGTNQQLATSEERFRLAIEAVGEGAYDWDVPTGKVYFSDQWLRWLGFAREEAMPEVSFWKSLLHPDDKPRVLHEFDQLLAGRIDQFDMEYRLRTKSGEYRWTRDRGRVITQSKSGAPLRVVGTEDDISDRKTAEDQLAYMELKLAHVARLSTMGELVASIAHEVNQPLFAIVNFAKASGRRLSSEEPSDRDALRELNDQIAECAVRAGAIIKRLRSFVSRGEPQCDWADANRLVCGACDMMAFSLRRAGVRVEFELAADLPPVMVDEVQIQQVLVNLLQNACEALEEVAPADRRIIVGTKLLGDLVSVLVADTGPGLPNDTGVNPFDSFVTTKPQGLGMGLPISKTIVEAHGGKLLAAGREGGGAEFLFTLPTEKKQ